MIGVLLTTWLSVQMTTAAAMAAEGPWLSTVRRMNTIATEAEFGDCNLQSIPGAVDEGGVCRSADADAHGVPYDVVQTAFEASTRMVDEAPAYALTATGDGPGSMSDRYQNSSSVNCTSSLEALMNASIHGDSNWQTCWADPVLRYMPGMAGSYFGRAHYYESQWRPNLLARRLVTEVTTCLPVGAGPSCNYEFRFDGTRFRALVTKQLKGSSTGKLFVGHLSASDSALETSVRALAASNCASLASVDAALRLDWPVSGAAAGSCSTAAAKATLVASYLALVRDVRAQAVDGLNSRPIVARTPCVSIGTGSNRFNPDTGFPTQWRRPGTVLLVAFVGPDPDNRQRSMIRHQGLVVFRDGKWWVRHASSIQGAYVEEEMTVFLRNTKFTGMNFLAPRDPSTSSTSGS